MAELSEDLWVFGYGFAQVAAGGFPISNAATPISTAITAPSASSAPSIAARRGRVSCPVSTGAGATAGFSRSAEDADGCLSGGRGGGAGVLSSWRPGPLGRGRERRSRRLAHTSVARDLICRAAAEGELLRLVRQGVGMSGANPGFQ